MSRLLALAVFLAALVAVPAYADRPTPESPAGRILGVLPAHGQAGHNGGGGSNLTYHFGPVMASNTAYAIFWSTPQYPIPLSYQDGVTRFFADVAADSGKRTNVYYSDTQYSSIGYQSSFGGAWVDPTPIASDCTDTATTACVSDSQIQQSVARAMVANGWTAGPSHLFFVFTAKGVGSCAGSACAFTYYCAYHSWIGSGAGATMYANMPYADTAPSACGTSEPNGNEADSTINVTSHEHNEAITDPQGTAWYDRRGQENGDKCAWNFGSPLGTTGSGTYNQLINGHTYWLQQE